MGISMTEIKKYINSVGGDITNEIDSEALVFDKYHPVFESKHTYIIVLQENGEMFQMRNRIGKTSEIEMDECQIALKLLNHNSQTKFGTWEIDADDGQITFSVEIPLEDNTLTTEQFKRIVKVSEGSTVEIMKLIKEGRSGGSI